MEKPAGFWIRAVASIIDDLIIYFFAFIMIQINTLIVLPLIDAGSSYMTEGQYKFYILIFGTIPVIAIIYIFGILYYSLLTSSKMQATLGKKLMGIIVVNQYGGEFHFGAALAVSSLTYHQEFCISVTLWRLSPLSWHYTIIFAGQKLSIKIKILIDEKNRLPRSPRQPVLLFPKSHQLCIASNIKRSVLSKLRRRHDVAVGLIAP